MVTRQLTWLRSCARCHVRKPLEAFAFANRATGERQSYCRHCQAAYRHGHYERNHRAYVDHAVRQIDCRRRHNRERVCEYLRAHPCVDCGETRLPVLDFDHRDPAKKTRAVTWLVARKSWKVVEAEIAKCDVRCANCHRRRTAAQFGWSRAIKCERARSGIIDESRGSSSVGRAAGSQPAGRRIVPGLPLRERL